MTARLAFPLVLVAACSGSGGPGSPDGGDPCEVPAYPDDLALDTAGEIDLPGPMDRAIGAGDAFLGCGDRQAWVGGPGGGSFLLEDDRLAGGCVAIARDGDRALVATAGGTIALLSVDLAGWSLAILASEEVAGAELHDALLAGDEAWIAAGRAGVLRYSVVDSTLAATTPLAGARDARGLARVGSALLVADGYQPGPDGGAEIRLFSPAGALAGQLTGLAGIATRVLVRGERAVALRPGFGFDVLAVGETSLALAYSIPVDVGMPVDADLGEDQLLVTALSRVVRFRLGDGEATAVSQEERPARGDLEGPWLTSLARSGDTVRVLAGDRLIPIAVGDGPAAPHIATESTTFTIGSVENEDLIRVDNAGSAPLIITGVETEAPFSAEIYAELATARDGCPGQFVVEPGEALLAWHRYQGPAGAWSVAPYGIRSNDPDQPELVVESEINRPVPAAGSEIDPADLPLIGGGRFRSADHVGRVLLAKLYNPH